jgi:hypothetical protein
MVSRKIYNSMPVEENVKFLDVSLNVPSYNCGLFKFDWELLIMVKFINLIKLLNNLFHF